MTKVVSLFRLVVYLTRTVWSKLVPLFSTCYFLNVKVAFFFHFLLAGYRLVFEEVLNSHNRNIVYSLKNWSHDINSGCLPSIVRRCLEWTKSCMHDKYLTACADNRELHFRTLLSSYVDKGLPASFLVLIHAIASCSISHCWMNSTLCQDADGWKQTLSISLIRETSTWCTPLAGKY